MRSETVLAIALGAAWFVGCDRSSQSKLHHDPERAKATLRIALDAWKSGQVQTLAVQSPPIRFADDDFMAGYQLTDYEWTQPNFRIMPFQDVKVVLILRDNRGRALRKHVTYQVGIEPTLTVLRSDN